MKNKNLFILNPFENLMPNWADNSNRKINNVLKDVEKMHIGCDQLAPYIL